MSKVVFFLSSQIKIFWETQRDISTTFYYLPFCFMPLSHMFTGRQFILLFFLGKFPNETWILLAIRDSMECWPPHMIMLRWKDLKVSHFCFLIKKADWFNLYRFHIIIPFSISVYTAKQIFWDTEIIQLNLFLRYRNHTIKANYLQRAKIYINDKSTLTTGHL